MTMHDSPRFSSLVRRTVLCFAAGAPLIAATAFATTAPKGTGPSTKEKSTRPESEKPKSKVEPPKATKPKVDEAKARAAAEKVCRQAESAVHDAMETANKAMRNAVMSFHDATDTEAAGLTDDQIMAMGEAVRSQINQAAKACTAKLLQTHDYVLAALTQAGAPASMLAKVENAFAKSASHMGMTTDYANTKLQSMVEHALAANDAEPGDDEDADEPETGDHD